MSQLTDLFTDIADAIREKKGTVEPIDALDFPSEIESITGGGGGESYNFGYAIDIEAQNTINKGDRIVAQSNSSATTPTLNATFTESELISMSKDKSVGIQSTGSYSSKNVGNGSTFVIWFRNAETGQFDTSYSITLENYPSTALLYNSFVLNDDGTLAFGSTYTSVSSATSYENCTIVFEIDKESKTATYRYIHLNFDNLIYGGSNSNLYKVFVDCATIDNHGLYASSSNNGGYGVACGDYVICKSIGHVTKIADGTYYSNASMLIVLKYDRTLHNFTLDYYTKVGEQPSFIASNEVRGNCVKIDENNILFKIGQYLLKYNMLEKSLAYGNSTGISFGCFSPNGKYVVNASGTSTSIIKVYEVSFIDLSITEKYNITFQTGGGTKHFGYASDDGRWVWTDCVQLFDMVNQMHYYVDGLSGSNHAIPNGFLDVHDFIDAYMNSSPYVTRIISLTPRN